MKKLISKPHLFFFGFAFAFILLGFCKTNISTNIPLFNTIFAFSPDFWCYISAVFFFLIGLNYFCLVWAKKEPKIWLTILHLFLQIISTLPFLFVVCYVTPTTKFLENNFLYFMDLNQALILSFIVFLISIFIHLINFFTSLFLKTK